MKYHYTHNQPQSYIIFYIYMIYTNNIQTHYDISQNCNIQPLRMLWDLYTLKVKSNLNMNIEWLNTCQKSDGGEGPPQDMVSPTINGVHLWCLIKSAGVKH